MKIEMKPIAFVQNERKEMVDDHWSTIQTYITLADHIATEALNGISDFSHLAIIFYMDHVQDEKATATSRHPRNNSALPKVGTFAQRNKNRPNKIGLTTVKLISRNDRKLLVRHLDAINGTPILDIKPVMTAFLPKEPIVEPAWTKAIMKNYW